MSIPVNFNAPGPRPVRFGGIVGPRGPQGYPGMESAEVQAIAADADASRVAAESAEASSAQSAADAQTALQAQFMTQDQGVATLIEDEAAGPQTTAALTARIRGTALSGKGERLVAALDQKRPAVLAVLGDSTAWKNGSGNYVGTDGNEWPRQIATDLGSDYATAEVTYRLLSSGTTYTAPAVISAPAPTLTTVAADSFARTAADLNGTTPDVGGAWSGPAGMYSLPGDGTAVYSGTGTTSSTIAATSAGLMDSTFTANVNSAGAGDVDCVASRVSGTTFLWVTIRPYYDTVVCKVTVSNVTTEVRTFTFAECGIPATGSNDVAVRVKHNQDGTVVFTAGTGTHTHTLAAGEHDTFATASAVSISGSLPGHVWKDVSVTVEVGAAITNSLAVYNGAMGSQDADWSRTNIAALLPVAPDAVVITHSHNHATQTPAQFEASLDALVAAIHDLHGDDVEVIVGGQNPQYAPTANPAQHNARQADLRRYARTRSFGYAPIFEAFMSQPSPQSLVRADGVHPTPAGIDLVGTTVHRYLAALSLKP